MDPGERKGWMEIISAEDLDTHMAEIGQAEANAHIVRQMFQESPIAGRILIPGCGTGQLFDYLTPTDLGDPELMFTDINPSYLLKISERLEKFPKTRYNTRVDDIEETTLTENYDGILIVLVLQHVEWKKALQSMQKLDPTRLYIIIQEQETTEHAVTKSRELRGAWRTYAEIANPILVPRGELIGYMEDKGYHVNGTYSRQVPDNKTMTGLVFEKQR